ncbi:MAG TPA: chloride channel protein [Anaerolineales bacterium]|nr:chloride channel protein [Anaerolineales bacterium]
MEELRNLKIKVKISSWLDRIPTSQTLSLGFIAVVVGLATGLGVWLFKRIIDAVQIGMSAGFGAFQPRLGMWIIVLIPVVGGVVVAMISRYLVGDEQVHGVAGIMESVALAGGRLRYKTAPAKILASAISIGVGASVGPEDPSVQIGANLGSWLGQLLHSSDERLRVLVAAGSAAAIAAAFNAPIAGVFFSLELILGEINGSSLGMLLVASVASSVVTQALSGPEPAFHVPTYTFHSVFELPLYLGLGLLAGPISALYTNLLYSIRDIFHGFQFSSWLKAAATGLAIGTIGLYLPQVLGVGYDTIQNILNTPNLVLWLLLALLIAKIILTPLSLGGGFTGGVFAPSLYLGATLGGAYGLIAARLFPGLDISPSAFALVGMAAVLAGSVHAPLTATILLFEMTNDYRIILPVMLAVAVSLLLSQRIQRDSIYITGLVRLGIRLDRGRDVVLLEAITVGEAMHLNTETLRESLPLMEAAETLAQSRHHGMPVINADGNLVGILTIRDIEKVEEAKRESTTVGQACTHELLVAYPHETLSDALLRMSHHDVGRLPVVDRNHPRKLVGILRRMDVIRAYEIALTRRATQRHRAERVRLDAVTSEDVDVRDITVENDAACAGKKMSEVPWPHDSLIATVRRRNKVFIPHGETVIKPGDILVVVAEGQGLEDVVQLCSPKRAEM